MGILSIDELIDQPTTPGSTRWPTGFTDLDALLGGFSPEQVWVITGEPGIGKTTLLCQLAYRLAVEHGFSTTLNGYSADGIDSYRRWLLAMVPGLRPGEEPVADDPRVRDLRSADLTVSDGGFELESWTHPAPSMASHQRALLIDDVEFKHGDVLDRDTRGALRQAAAAGAFVMVTSPLRFCFETVDQHPPRARLRHEWAETADVILELVPAEGPSDHDDVSTLDLVIRRHRRGQRGTQRLLQVGDGLLSPSSH